MIDKIKSKVKWVKSADWVGGLTLFFASLLFFYDLLGGRYILTERDLSAYFIPPRFFWVESIKNGEFPLWNPYQFSGHPFFANPQHAVLYPINTLFFILPFDLAFNSIIILHFFLAGLFVYLLLKDMNASPTGSLLSGLIFMLSGYLLSVHSLLTILLSVVWTPLIMLFFRRAMINPGIKNEILTAIFMTISFLGGGVEIVYGNFFVLLFMVIFSPLPDIEFVGDKPRRYKFFGSSVPIYWGRIRSLSIISITFLLLSAVQLIPFLELFHHSIRGQGIPYREATVWSFAPKDILLFFLPDAHGYFLDMKKYWINQCWFKTLYTGGLPFLLSSIFFIFGNPVGERLCGLPQEAAAPACRQAGKGRHYRISRFDRGRKLLLSLMLLSLFLSLGQYNPLYPYVFKYLPFFNGVRYPVKFLYIFILVLAISAGLGFQRMTEFSQENEKKILKKLLIVLSLASGLLLLFFILGHASIEHFLKSRGVDFPDFNHLSVNLHHTKRFLFYLALFFLLLRVGHEVKWKVWAKVLLVFFLTADLFGNMGFYGKEKTSEYFKKTKILETISSDKRDFRIFSTAKTISLDTPILIADTSPLDIFKEKHLPSLNLLYQLHDIWGIDVIRLRRVDNLYKVFTSTPSISTTNLLDLYGVKYIISVTPLGEDPRFELIYSRLEGLQGKEEDLIKENTVKLYRTHNSFPRAWLLKKFEVLENHAILSKMLTKEFHPDQKVLLEEEPQWVATPACRQAGKGRPYKDRYRGNVEEPLRELQNKVEFISESNNMVQLHVRAKENALLVLTDTYYPGWKAFVYPVRYDSYHQGNLVETKLSNGVDGKETKILRANYNFRAISLEAGEHGVKFIYDPMSFKIGMLVSLLTLIGIVFYFVRRKWRVS